MNRASTMSKFEKPSHLVTHLTKEACAHVDLRDAISSYDTPKMPCIYTSTYIKPFCLVLAHWRPISHYLQQVCKEARFYYISKIPTQPLVNVVTDEQRKKPSRSTATEVIHLSNKFMGVYICNCNYQPFDCNLTICSYDDLKLFQSTDSDKSSTSTKET